MRGGGGLIQWCGGSGLWVVDLVVVLGFVILLLFSWSLFYFILMCCDVKKDDVMKVYYRMLY